MIPPSRRRIWLFLAIPLLAVVGSASALFGARGSQPAQSKPDAVALEKQVRALFQAQCYRCHSHQANKSRGGLMLDSLASMRKGGKTAPAIVPGDPDRSLLYKAVLQVDEDLQMPRDGKLKTEEIALLRTWILAGAPWTDTPGKAEL